jgi:hypothetical protein
MQATLFKEMIDMFANQFTVGSCYEITQGMVK